MTVDIVESSLSTGQDKALTVLSIVSSLLSVTGSSIIVAATTRRHKRGAYERLLSAMSACDIFASLDFAIQTFLTPRGKWALSLGNEISCVVAGTLFQFGTLSSMIYYNMLAVFFLLTIRFNMDATIIEQRIEPWMHFISIGWPIVTAIAGIIVKAYGPLVLYQGCWMHGPDATMITWVTVGPWLLSSYSFIPIIFVIIYRSVWQAYRGSLFRQQSQSEQGRVSVRESQQAKRLKLLGGQACLFVIAYFTTYSFVFAGQVIEAYAVNPQDLIKRLYPLLVFQASMTPLAGFFNCLIFIRPRYLQMRDRYKNDSSTFLAFTTIRSLILGSSSQSAAGTSAFPGGSTTQENNNHNNNSSNNHHRLAQMNWSQNAYLQDITSGFAGARTSCLVEEDDVEEAADMFKVETSQSQVESTKDPTEQIQAVHFCSND